MSNLDPAPGTVSRTTADDRAIRLLDYREVPLGGPRAMTVRRSLPQHGHTLIGAWCFVDHYGPDEVASRGGMAVDGHPHTGLQTASWLFSGQVEHRDTTGTHAVVRPGELNLMTAGSGIAHSEYSTPDTTVLHGAQLWIALPNEHRFTAPGFERYVPAEADCAGARMLVFLGSLHGQKSPVRTYTPLLGAELTLPAGQQISLEIDTSFEHGILVDTGSVALGGVTAGAGQLLFSPTGAPTLDIAAPAGPTRILLLGGEPLGEHLVMWWNFIGRTHEEVAAYRAEWELAQHGEAGRYGTFPPQWQETIPAPQMPNLRLKPRP